jgi:hypothetical protein
MRCLARSLSAMVECLNGPNHHVRLYRPCIQHPPSPPPSPRRAPSPPSTASAPSPPRPEIPPKTPSTRPRSPSSSTRSRAAPSEPAPRPPGLSLSPPDQSPMPATTPSGKGSRGTPARMPPQSPTPNAMHESASSSPAPSQSTPPARPPQPSAREWSCRWCTTRSPPIQTRLGSPNSASSYRGTSIARVLSALSRPRREYHQVKNWFSNQRQKDARDSRQSPQPSASSNLESSLSKITCDGRDMRIRTSALDVCTADEWSDAFFDEVVMIHNFRLLAKQSQDEAKATLPDSPVSSTDLPHTLS